MAYDVFKRVVSRIVSLDPSLSVKFRKANGRFYGNVSNGTTFIGNSIASSLEVRDGNLRSIVNKERLAQLV